MAIAEDELVLLTKHNEAAVWMVSDQELSLAVDQASYQKKWLHDWFQRGHLPGIAEISPVSGSSSGAVVRRWCGRGGRGRAQSPTGTSEERATETGVGAPYPGRRHGGHILPATRRSPATTMAHPPVSSSATRRSPATTLGGYPGEPPPPPQARPATRRSPATTLGRRGEARPEGAGLVDVVLAEL